MANDLDPVTGSVLPPGSSQGQGGWEPSDLQGQFQGRWPDSDPNLGALGVSTDPSLGFAFRSRRELSDTLKLLAGALAGPRVVEGGNGMLRMNNDAGPAVVDYDPLQDSRYEDRPDLWPFIMYAESPGAADLIAGRVDYEKRINETLAMSNNFAGTLGEIGAIASDPLNWAGPTAAFRAATLLRGALKAGSMGALATTTQEVIRQQNAETVSGMESAQNILVGTAVSALLGGIMGSQARGSRVVLPSAGKIPTGRIETPPMELKIPPDAATAEGMTDRSVGAMQRYPSSPVDPQGEFPQPIVIRIPQPPSPNDQIAANMSTGPLGLPPVNPVFRVLEGENTALKQVMGELANDGGVYLQKNIPRGIQSGEAKTPPVELEAEFDMLRAYMPYRDVRDEALFEYRLRVAQEKIPSSKAGELFSIGKMEVKELGRRLDDYIRGVRGEEVNANPNAPLRSHGFDQEVVRAVRAGGTHEIPEVAKAAGAVRKMLDDTALHGQRVDLWAEHLDEQFAYWSDKVAEMKKEIASLKATPARDISEMHRSIARERAIERTIARKEAQLSVLEEKIRKTHEFGPTTNTARGYFPRVWLHDQVIARYDELKGLIKEHALEGKVDRVDSKGRPISETAYQAKLDKMAGEIIDHGILGQKEVADIVDAKLVDEVGLKGWLRERSLDIPDEILDEHGFLSNDLDGILSRYMKGVYTDAALKKKFGSVSMKRALDEADIEHAAMMRGIDDPARRAKADKEYKARRDDVLAVRDRMRGNFGQPRDPHSLPYRAIRIAKQMATITMSGGFAVSSLPDIGAIVMSEGLLNVARGAVNVYFGETGRIIREMSKKELKAAGAVAEWYTNHRALQMADIGDTFGRKFPFEAGLAKVAEWSFVLNGLTFWNNEAKKFAGALIMQRLNEVILKGYSKSAVDVARLNKSFISAKAAEEMMFLLKKHGKKTQNIMVDPNTFDWNKGVKLAGRWKVTPERGAELQRLYQLAVKQDVERLIVTPGAGDRALWTSTPVGSLIAQFQGFGQAYVSRVLVPGLQEQQAAFFTGAGVMLALGFLVHEMKRGINGDNRPESISDKVIESIDRSGITGWLSPFNSALETFSGNTLGVRPFFGSPQGTPSLSRVAGAVAPAAGLAVNDLQLIADIISGAPAGQIWNRAKKNIPLHTHPNVAPVLRGDLPFVSKVSGLMGGDETELTVDQLVKRGVPEDVAQHLQGPGPKTRSELNKRYAEAYKKARGEGKKPPPLKNAKEFLNSR